MQPTGRVIVMWLLDLSVGCSLLATNVDAAEGEGEGKGEGEGVCGNGQLDPGEECDDGNKNNGDACSSTCRLPVCGNGLVEGSEPCDDGDTWWEDWWPTNCLWHPEDIARLARLKAGETRAVRRQLRAAFAQHKEKTDD